MALIYAGIDEAGYGPMLGPLCVSMAAFRVNHWTPGDPAPDLWSLLSKAVGRAAKDAPSLIPFADSKKLKLSNQLKTKHPLTHLERGVLCALACAGSRPTTDADLFEALGASLGSGPWYGGEPVPLPVGNGADAIRIDANRLADACELAAVEPLAIECRAVPEPAFNDIVRESGSKAATTARVIAGLVRLAAEAWLNDGDALRIVCDRQSGRSDYMPLLGEALPDAQWTMDGRSATDSRYTGRTDGGSFGVHFVVEAENAHLPVALASMSAKLVRELAMARFNRYWSALNPELKPTAGYVQDARRWLSEVGGVMSELDRAAVVRIA